jgi:hypothetical protein
LVLQDHVMHGPKLPAQRVKAARLITHGNGANLFAQIEKAPSSDLLLLTY